MLSGQQEPLHDGILFDEIEIPYGLMWLRPSARIVGSMLGSIVVAEKEVEKLVELGDNLPDHLGKRILQLFFMSTTNGSLCIPLAFYLSTGATGKWVYSVMRECIQKLHHFRIKITWGCSDMFAGWLFRVCSTDVHFS